jgi:elongator complex protein 3
MIDLTEKIEEEIIENAILTGALDSKSFARARLDVLRNYGTPLPKGANLLFAYKRLLKAGKIDKSEPLENILKFKQIRTRSGVAPVAILTKPAPCPGECVFCPTEQGMPQSYLSVEPAVMRAIRANFDAEEQVKSRLFALNANGNLTDKIELIVMGGTFSALENSYKEKFIKEAFDGLNGVKSKNLEDAQKINEIAKHRCVGLTLETRPDFIDEKEVLLMRRLGATRVELGVQSLYDEILEKNQRGHGVDETIKATRLLKEAGFKVGYHMMPNLPGSDLEKDFQMLIELFNNPDFQPDQLKIYPCVAVKGSDLFQWYIDGKYSPYNEEQLIDLLIEVKKSLPYYVRVSRLFRDIPSPRIGAGIKLTNLRQVIKDKMHGQGQRCNCIRCREIGNRAVLFDNEITVFRQDYRASDGREIFLSFEDKDRKNILAFLRLRMPGSSEKSFIKEIAGAAIVRELHTYGPVESIGENNDKIQHRGLGKKLLNEAEKIVKESGIKKIAVISGVGARDYYRKFGYELTGTYMVKDYLVLK